MVALVGECERRHGGFRASGTEAAAHQRPILGGKVLEEDGQPHPLRTRPVYRSHRLLRIDRAMTEHSNVLARLATSRFRSRFRLGARERAYAEARGRDRIESHAGDFIAQRLAPAVPRNDGRQTPMRGHPVRGPARHRHLLSRMSGEVARHRARSRADGRRAGAGRRPRHGLDRARDGCCAPSRLSAAADGGRRGPPARAPGKSGSASTPTCPCPSRMTANSSSR